ncbi:MAG: 4-(cytidine 5'-diphospho)-2-C-methyl-D-erythritol kinase [Desulfovibrio sp.]|uniref:4-(cytidine 5'-diphospho)-2-C-methyl-D-erythritol kinase n=1 Tax=Desulfovibrio sp. 7SRBS1 TaxID=3378064 RepID=UPI003B3F5C42
MNTAPQAYAEATLHAPCKVNLYLKITGRRPDGYHDLESLFMPLHTPSDILHVTPVNKEGLELQCPGLDCSTESNLIFKAYEKFRQAAGFAPGLVCRVEKNIPSGAGLGGGSSDAACMLRYLNKGAGCRSLATEALNSLAVSLGADVPFFLQDGPAWACGVGEQLRPVQLELSGKSLLLVCPKEKVATGWAYSAWDKLEKKEEIGTVNFNPELTATCETGKDPLCLERVVFFNSFEAAVFPVFPRLRTIKETLVSEGAAGVVMSGSGASICALFNRHDRAENAVKRLSALDADGQMCFIHQV